MKRRGVRAFVLKAPRNGGMSGLPTIAVHLDDAESGVLSWKPRGQKGARWRKARSIDEACRLADATLAAPRDIEFVVRKD